MNPPPLASDAHSGFIRVDGVTILLQRPSDRLHDRFPAIGHLTDAAHYRAGPQPNLPFIAKPCANSLDGKPWVPLHIDDAGDNPQGPVKVFVLQLRLLSFGVGMGNVRAGSGREVQWSML